MQGRTPMNKFLATFLIGLMLAIFCGSIVRARPLGDAMEAAKRHDYATALRLLRPPAEQGAAMRGAKFQEVRLKTCLSLVNAAWQIIREALILEATLI